MDATNHFVYILKCKDNTLYTGYTIDVERRVQMHESGKGAKYTRGRGPFEIMYTQWYETKEEALRTEYKIKQLTRQEKDQLIKMKAKGVTADANTEKF